MVNFNEKSKSAYNKKADNYDYTPEGKFTRKFQRLLISEMPLIENSNVLDVACGTGSLLADINRTMPICGFGIDISDRMIENAAMNNPNMVFRVSGLVVNAKNAFTARPCNLGVNKFLLEMLQLI